MEALRIYEKNDEVNESEHDDLWDDKVLVKAYNKSVKEIKQKIAQRIGLCNGNSDVSEPANESTASIYKRTKTSVKNYYWTEGDLCRAIYSVDGLEYEAKIVTIVSDEMCIVEFYGYGNQETVRLEMLKNSLGKRARNAQKLAANENNDFDEDEPDIRAEHGSFPIPTIPGVHAIPPPPAFNLSSELNCDDESDALSAMLMSWYMSGYHTGYYQGLLQRKKKS